MGLSQALGIMIGGLAMFGGAKIDELASKENMLNRRENVKSSDKEAREYIIWKARNNVGAPLSSERKSKSSLGAGKATATFIQGMTGNLGDPEALKKFIKGVGDIAGNEKNTQGDGFYNVLSQNEQQQKEAIEMLRRGWRGIWGELGRVNLSSEASSMSEATRMNAYNNNSVFSEIKLKNPENF